MSPGPGFTVSSEQLSGVVALELAARALRHGELDAALVGAVEVVMTLVLLHDHVQLPLPRKNKRVGRLPGFPHKPLRIKGCFFRSSGFLKHFPAICGMVA